MHTFLRRRLDDGVFFIILVLLLGGFAKVLHLHPSAPSDSRHLILQAQAWLHGHLDIGLPRFGDSILFQGKTYIIYPPLPSLIMLPFVAILGDRFSDIWFTWLFAAGSIVLLFSTLEVMRVRSITTRTSLENRILALTFGFGTIALWLCLGGRVWMTIQTVSVFGIMVMLHGTLSRRWPLAALGVGMVMLTRTSEVLVGIVPLVAYLHDLGIGRRVQGRWSVLPQRWPALRELAVTLAPFLIAALILLVHNQLYFGNMLSTGYDIQNQQNYPQIVYGVTSWHYIWPNFIVDFLRWPSFSYTGPFDVNPQVNLAVDGIGTNMFFSTPLLAIFIFAPQGKTAQPWLRRTLWITVAITLLAVLTFCAAGWYQVGSRYLLPLYPLLFLLLAQRSAPLDARWIGLAGLGVFVNLLLARVFWNRPPSLSFTLASAAAALLACVVALILLRVARRRSLQQEDSLSPVVEKVPVGSTR